MPLSRSKSVDPSLYTQVVSQVAIAVLMIVQLRNRIYVRWFSILNGKLHCSNSTIFGTGEGKTYLECHLR